MPHEAPFRLFTTLLPFSSHKLDSHFSTIVAGLIITGYTVLITGFMLKPSKATEAAPAAPNAGFGGQAENNPVGRVRKFFPETWLFDLVVIG